MSKSRAVRSVGGRKAAFVAGSLGLAGSILLTSSALVSAQEAAPAPAAPACSGFMCLLAPHAAAERQAEAPAAQPVAAAQPVTAAAEPVPEAEPKAEKPKAKPRPTVTIAVDATEAAKLKTLVSAMPKDKIRIVAEKAADTGADFAIRTAFDPRRSGTEEARLFTEQMHVVAGGAIHSLEDLKGRVVSFGPDQSSSQMAARKAFAGLGITVKETPLDLDNALDGLATGDIAAVVILAPQPVTRLKGVSAPGLHLVAWPDGAAVPSGAVAASIDGADYPALAKPGETINAMGVDAVLTLGPKGTRAPAAKAFLAALSQRSETLSKRGFDLLKADLDSRTDRRVASIERR